MGQEYPFGRLGYEVRKAIRKDLDVKIIIISHNSRPGLGKTTLAIQMARAWDQHGWTVDDKAFMDVHEYRQAYRNEKPGSVLLFDEIERAADSRRAMSHENVGLSQDWATLRYRNMVSIATLPTTSMLDNRMLEMSDYWIRVVKRGEAWPYKVKVNDFNGRVWRQRMGPDENMVIGFPDLGEGDDDYAELKRMKAEDTRSSEEHLTMEEAKKMQEAARQEAQKDVRDEMIRDLYDTFDVSYNDISELETVGLRTTRVGEIVNSD